jgi:hypothetical protein
VIVVTLPFCLSVAKAADITVDYPPGGKTPIVSVIGEIKPNDGDRFATLVIAMPTAIVALASPGGNVLAAIKIGKIVRNSRFTTVVPEKMTCASACALVWLAGVRRYVWGNARIGFHGAFNPATMQQSGPGNAIVGAYLSELGISDEAIVYMTAASPTDMQWLHSDDARRLGFAADELSSSNPDKPITVENYGAEWKLKSEALSFVTNFFDQFSILSDEKLLSALANSYANYVDYNGAKKSAAEVLADKIKWRKRWPIQKYTLNLESLITNCSERMAECMTTGIVAWVSKRYDSKQSVSGNSRFSLYLGKVSQKRFVILGESYAVLSAHKLGLAVQ